MKKLTTFQKVIRKAYENDKAFAGYLERRLENEYEIQEQFILSHEFEKIIFIDEPLNCKKFIYKKWF